MRKTILCAALSLAASLVPAIVSAQQTATASLPQDPAALLALAHDKNGLTGPDVKPWHIRGTYTFYDSKGKPERTGTYEEWWVGPGKYKRSFTSPQFTQTDYGNGTQLFRDGEQKWPDSKEMLLRSLLITPVPDSSTLQNFKLDMRTVKAGTIQLSCTTLQYQLRNNLKVSSDYFPVYCISQDVPVLRIAQTGSQQRIIYNKIVLFQGRYIAREIHDTYSGKPRIDFNTEVIEPLQDAEKSLLTPPATAHPVDLNAVYQNDLSHTLTFYPIMLKHAVPVYPELALTNRVQGTVTIRATVARDGHLGKLAVIDGPGMLQQAAKDAVSQWLYEPFVVLDQPIPVEIETHVVFSLGR